jgi:hypothetical protein
MSCTILGKSIILWRVVFSNTNAIKIILVILLFFMQNLVTICIYKPIHIPIYAFFDDGNFVLFFVPSFVTLCIQFYFVACGTGVMSSNSSCCTSIVISNRHYKFPLVVHTVSTIFFLGFCDGVFCSLTLMLFVICPCYNNNSF